MSRAIPDGGNAARREREWIEFITLCSGGHWGVVVAIRDARGRALVGWGDAMHLTPPTDILHLVTRIRGCVRRVGGLYRSLR